MLKIAGLFVLILSILLVNSCKKDKPTPPSITTSDVTAISYTTATSGGSVTNEGSSAVSSKGVCWSTLPSPTVVNNKTNESSGLGAFASNITQLTANTMYYVRAYATNSAGIGYGNEVSFSTLPAAVPTLTTIGITSIAITTAVSGGNITADNGGSVTSRGVCWGTSTNPTIEDSKTSDGSGTGNFVSNIIGLKGGTTYYARSYAINSVGTTYGNEINFTTNPPTVPVLSTTIVSSIKQTTASSGGIITSDGGASVTVRGVCWGISSTPSTAGSKTTDGTDIGQFTSKIIHLSANTIYYLRAYATNSVGTSYGNEISFTTSMPVLATLTTVSVTLINSTLVKSGGDISNDGGAAVTARGVCWNTSANPTISNNLTTDGADTGSFVSSLTGLTASTTYYVRAYATNSVGTAYGDQQTFTTDLASVIDFEGNIYDVIRIGTQLWTKENLKATKYNNGDPIPSVSDSLTWNHLTTGAVCDYDTPANSVIYGKLYNLYAVNDSRNICPTGWHVPKPTEWSTLLTYLGWDSSTGGKLKETGLAHWAYPNTGATNESGFTALPGGMRFPQGSVDIRQEGYWWAASSDIIEIAMPGLFYNRSDFNFAGGPHGDSINGLSVRCLKDN